MPYVFVPNTISSASCATRLQQGALTCRAPWSMVDKQLLLSDYAATELLVASSVQGWLTFEHDQASLIMISTLRHC